jgi:hypothetical protein
MIKTLSEETMLKLIIRARTSDKRATTFASEVPKSDQQKLHRIKQKQQDREKEEALPLFPDELEKKLAEWDFKTSTTADSVTIWFPEEEAVVLLDNPVKIEKVQPVKETKEKKAKKQQQSKTIDDAMREIEKHERLGLAAPYPGPELFTLHTQLLDTMKIAVEYYADLSPEEREYEDGLTRLLKSGMSRRGERFDSLVIAAFAPQHLEYRPEPKLSRREQLAKRMGEIRNSNNSEDIREMKLLLIEHDQLVKEEDAKWQDPNNILG